MQQKRDGSKKWKISLGESKTVFLCRTNMHQLSMIETVAPEEDSGFLVMIFSWKMYLKYHKTFVFMDSASFPVYYSRDTPEKKGRTLTSTDNWAFWFSNVQLDALFHSNCYLSYLAGHRLQFFIDTISRRTLSCIRNWTVVIRYNSEQDLCSVKE